ncbi:MAG: CAP domain-containing protein [Patescibacteria group bacterium]|jgi:hypothetical protein
MFGQTNKKSQEKNLKWLKTLGIFSIIFNAICFLIFYVNPKRWKIFVRGQKKEINELSQGQEDFGRFCKDSACLIKDFFIPYDGNDNKPRALRPKSLLSYALIVISVKLLVTGFLFITYPTPAELSTIISSNMINLVNESRKEAGIEPLVSDTFLEKFAQAKGQDMINRDYFAHDTPEGKKPWQWIDRGEYDYVYAGENLAMDFKTAETVHEAFMKSPSHRRNILNPKYKEVGMAVIEGQIGGHQTILLVEFFGTQRKDLSTLAKTPEPVKQNAEVALTNQNPENANVAGEQVTPTEEEIQITNQNPTEYPNEGLIVVATEEKSGKALVDLVIEYSNIFFLAFLIFILISLALNIFIKIKVQHASIILQSVVVIALLLAMILVKFHFVEQVSHQLLIL